MIISCAFVEPTMTDENEINVNGERENLPQLPLSMIVIDSNRLICIYLSLEMLLETSTHSTIERSIHNILRENFLEQRSITWKPIKVELIVNSSLTEDFFGK